MKLLCSLPGIEQTLLSVLQTLTSHISESRDRGGRLHQRVDDLSTQLLALREEFCSLQKSAIVVPDKAPARPTQHQVQGDKSRTRTKPRNRPPQQGQPDPAAAANQLDPADADAGQQSGQIDVASGSAQHETRTRTDDPGFVDPEPVQSDCEKSQPIMAVIKDDSWKLVAAGPPRKKRSVFFVGNLSHDCTVDSLTEFVHRRSESVGTPVKAHQCSLHTAGNGQVSARISVDATSKLTVTSANFWPRPLYCRPWRFHTSTNANAATSTSSSKGSRHNKNNNSTSSSTSSRRSSTSSHRSSTSSRRSSSSTSSHRSSTSSRRSSSSDSSTNQLEAQQHDQEQQQLGIAATINDFLSASRGLSAAAAGTPVTTPHSHKRSSAERSPDSLSHDAKRSAQPGAQPPRQDNQSSQ